MDTSTPNPASPSAAPALPAEERRAARWLWLLALGPALLWACWRALFFPLDDVTFIANSAKLAESTSWWAMWRPTPESAFYYPLTLTTWRLDRALLAPCLEPLAGDAAWPAAIRITSLLLHLAAAFFVWKIARRLGASAALAAFVLAAFALHPTACESVCWCVERKTVLAGCLGLGAVMLYVSAESWRGYALAAALFAAALLSKPSALGLLPVVACWELLGRPLLDGTMARQKSDRAKRMYVGAALRLGPWVALAAAGTWVGMRQQHLNLQTPPGGSIFTALLTDVEILARYAGNFLLPVGLSGHYAVEPIVSLADPRLWGYGTVCAALVAATFLLAMPGTRRAVAFAWLWAVGALGPNLNLIGINDLMHDRFAYLSAPGFWLAVGLALQGAGARWAARQHLPAGALGRLARIGIVALAVVWALSAANRSGVFAGLEPWASDAVAKQPRSASAHLYLAGYQKALAEHFAGTGQPTEAARARAEAVAHYEAGIAARDWDRYLFQARAHADLALLYYATGRPAEAAAEAERSLAVTRGEGRIDDVRADAHRMLGQLALDAGRRAEALGHFETATALAPKDPALPGLLERARALPEPAP
ncbi:MAG: glycosyltransferase family 39 protein [Planctomycetes bacterium]|nr:glycosyltransferase family 39 protein [Planctomycetota bacterium]